MIRPRISQPNEFRLHSKILVDEGHRELHRIAERRMQIAYTTSKPISSHEKKPLNFFCGVWRSTVRTTEARVGTRLSDRLES